MPTHDINGREYAKLSTVKVGSKLQVDGGFPCMTEGCVKIVHANANGELYIYCNGPDDELSVDQCEHTLDGQLDDENGDSLIGLYPIE